MTGAGLTDESAQMLTNFLVHLNTELEKITNNPGSSNFGIPIVSPQEEDIVKSILKTKIFVAYASKNQGAALTAEVNMNFQSNIEAQIVGTLGTNDGSMIESIYGDFTNSASALTNAADQVSEVSKELEDTLKKFNVNVGFLNELLSNPESISNALENAGNLASTGDKGAFILTNLLPPKVVSQLNAAEFQSAASQVGKIFKDIQSESSAANLRLLTFFSDLAKAELSLYQENARHYQTLNQICSQELLRWHSLTLLNASYENLYTPDSAPGTNSPPTLPPIHLFENARNLADWSSYYAREITNGDYADRGWTPPDLKEFPPCAGSTAKRPNFAQYSAVGRVRPRFSKKVHRHYQTRWGFIRSASYDRLLYGVQAVTGYTLMIGLDQRLAEENSILPCSGSERA